MHIDHNPAEWRISGGHGNDGYLADQLLSSLCEPNFVDHAWTQARRVARCESGSIPATQASKSVEQASIACQTGIEFHLLEDERPFMAGSMLNFAQLVEREDHKPYVRQYSTAGSRSVVVADLHYFEPTTVRREVTETVLSVHLMPVRLKAEIGGRQRETAEYTPGLFDLTPANTLYASERYDRGHALAISFPTDLISEALEEVAPGFTNSFGDLHERPHGSGLVAPLCRQIVAEVSDDSPMGPLYADTLVQSLILELYRRSCHTPAPCKADSHKLSPGVMSLIDEFIDQNTIATVELKELANVASLPSASFSRLFKQTTQQTPYQYVLQRRVQKARELIELSNLPLAQIAFQCGFASQSHMTDVFRTRLRTTPGKLRKDML